MRRLILGLAAVALTHTVFAADMMSFSKNCQEVAKACTDAGFSRGENAGKKFWQDCMRLVLLGKSVDGVKVEASTVKACRTDKVNEMKKELKELQKVSLR